MNIWNKVLVGLIAVVSLPLFYFSIVALKTHHHWRSAAVKIEKKLPGLEKEILRIKYGDRNAENSESLQSVRIELQKYFVNRGRIWRNCVFQQVGNNEVRLALPKDAKGLELHMIVYAIDQADVKSGGCFLGEFRVKAIDGNSVVLEPTMRLTATAQKRIQQSANGQQALWTLRELMPTDLHGVFAGKSEEELRGVLPESVIAEYLAELKGTAERKLRDYTVLLKEIDRQQTILLEENQSATRHDQYMAGASEDAKKQQLFRQDERGALLAELAKVTRERKAALAHQETLENELSRLQAQIAQLVEDNKATAKEIAEMQAKMLRQADRRSAVAAQ